MYMFIYSKCFAGSSHKKCVYPTIRIYLLKKCIHYYTYKNALHCQFSRCRQQCAHTCICILFQKKCTPYHTYQFAGSSQEKKTKHSFAGRLMTATQLRSARALPLHCFCSFTAHAVHTICRPYTPLPRPGPACRPHSPAVAPTKTKKRCKNTGNTRCIKKKNMKKEIKMDKYRKKNQKNKRK